MPFTLRKPERLSKKKIIEKMFQGGESRSFTIFPLRIVFMPAQEQEVPLSMMVSVSKRHFKRAVKRNRVKRLVREAWRLQKQPLAHLLAAQQKPLAVVLIYLADELPTYATIEQRVQTAILRLCEFHKPMEDETTA
ncbi:MAG: ribonuclease P protein component [Bacteroidaceae bacterium]|nr:ribonuclease P protein component [Bacteroidaceae bacterium]